MKSLTEQFLDAIEGYLARTGTKPSAPSTPTTTRAPMTRGRVTPFMLGYGGGADAYPVLDRAAGSSSTSGSTSSTDEMRRLVSSSFR